MPTFAAVDVGSNSVRLKIAKLVRGRLETVHEDREVTRLGESVFRSGLLDPEAIAHTVKVLRRFHRAAVSDGMCRGLVFVPVKLAPPLSETLYRISLLQAPIVFR